MKPPKLNENTQYNLRNSNEYGEPLCRHNLHETHFTTIGSKINHPQSLQQFEKKTYS